jgi:exodeoxyribonuclease VII large subunit
MSEYITVTQLNKTIKQLFDQTAFLKRLSVMGELSNYKRHSSGTYYFTLKDQGSEIKCVMFASAAQKVSTVFKEGDQVIASGDVNVYDVRGEYQLYVSAMRPTGAGDIYAKLEALKKKLLAEGLLEESHKKPLPRYPRVVGVITSPTGAAVQDIQNTIARRFPLAAVRIYPALVQGDDAKYSITKQIEKANQEALADVLIVGRGGGSIEDLWAFNEELVLRAIFASTIPIISAVGHETDTTLSDLIADRRAPTPTAAAELAVPDRIELLQFINSQQTLLKTRIANLWQSYYRRYQRASASYVLTQPERLLAIQAINL